MNAETLQQLIEQGLPGARARVSGEDGVHFEATVVAEAFRGQTRMRQHKLVYEALGALMQGPIHALSLKTSSP